MKSKHFLSVTLVVVLMLPVLTVRAAGQGGWIPSINPGWVSPPVGSATTPTPRVGPVHGGIGVEAGRAIVIPPPPPSAHLGTPEARQDSHVVPVTTRPPDALIYADVYPEPVLVPYLYAPFGVVGSAVSGGSTRDIETGSRSGGIFRGMSRTAVIELLGRPSAIVYRTSQESLVYSNVTVIIQNGVVANIQ